MEGAKTTKKSQTLRKLASFPLLVTSPWYHHGRFMIRNFSKCFKPDCPTDSVLVGVPKGVAWAENHFFPKKTCRWVQKTPKSEHFCLQNCVKPKWLPSQISSLTVNAKSENKNVHVSINLVFLVFFKSKEKTWFSQSKWGPRTSWTHLSQSEGQSEMWEILWSQILEFSKSKKKWKLFRFVCFSESVCLWASHSRPLEVSGGWRKPFSTQEG